MLFCPSSECETIPLEYFQKAKSIDCALYDLNLPSWIDALNKSGVRLIVEGDNQDVDLPEFTMVDANKALMHHKFCVVDKQIVITGSMNPTINGVTKNNNNLLIIKSYVLAAAFTAEFDEMYNGVFGGGARDFTSVERNASWEIRFCPEERCRDFVLGKLNADYVDVLVFSFTDEQVALRLAGLGSNSRVLQEKRQARQKYAKTRMLQRFGVEVREDGNKANMHHKVMIIENSSVVFGSYNPTEAGAEKNDEVILWTNDYDIVNKFRMEFEKLWSSGEKVK